MAEKTLFETCSDQFSTDELTDLLSCIADGHEANRETGHLDVASGLDSFYLIFAGALVFFMQTGFAMLCAGSIRSKNVKNVMLWNLLDSCGGGIAFWITGYAFAYGGDTTTSEWTFIGAENFFLMGEVNHGFWFFQFAFACALSSIVAGTIAERTQMKGYLFYSFFLVGFVYPIVAHAFWSTNGFLANTTAEPLWGSGALDFAGSGPVHMCGGVTALMAAIVLGPRLGRFYGEDGTPLEEPAEIPGHSTPLAMLGTFALWFGWYGFNPGSTFGVSSANSGEVAALVAVNTTLAACAGALSAMFTSTWLGYRTTGLHSYDVAYTMNGLLTGLVAVTAGCASVESWAAVVIGIVAGWIYLASSKLLIKLRIDDAVDAIPVHMFGGAWGLISTGLFSAPDLMEKAYGQSDHVGWFYEWGRGSGNFTLLGIQLIGCLFIIGWTSALMYPYFYVLNLFGSFRVDPAEEAAGMDISRHNGPGYNLEDSSHNEAAETLKEKRASAKISKSEEASPKKDVEVDA
jgi:Amt family ammonium transporter